MTAVVMHRQISGVAGTQASQALLMDAQLAVQCAAYLWEGLEAKYRPSSTGSPMESATCTAKAWSS